MQAAIGHPLTVHGSGRQTRAFIHIRDTVRCIELTLNSPWENRQRVRIFNQMTETHRIIDLAKRIADLTGVPWRSVSTPGTKRRQTISKSQTTTFFPSNSSRQPWRMA